MDRFLAGKDGGKILEKLRARGWDLNRDFPFDLMFKVFKWLFPTFS
jgi:hypothetical protein